MSVVTIGSIQALATVKDEIGGKLASMKGAIVAAGAAIGAIGLKVGADWDKARAEIVDGTGATGDALDGLMDSYQNLAGTVKGPVATAIADLNTHTGLTGKALEDLAAKALKAGVDTNAFGTMVRQMGLDSAGSAKLLDQLKAISQSTGVSMEELTLRVGRNALRFQQAGGTMDELVATVSQVAHEFGPQGLSGNMTQVMTLVNQGVIPSVASLDEQLGDVTGTVERSYAASLSLADRWKLMRERASALIGPMGNVIGVLGSLGAMAPMMGTLATAARAMWAGLTGPIGLVVTGVALAGAAFWKFREHIGNALSAVISFVTPWALRFVDSISSAVAWIPGLGPKLASAADGVKEKLQSMSDGAAAWTDSWGEAEEATADITAGLGEFEAATSAAQAPMADLLAAGKAQKDAAKAAAEAQAELESKIRSSTPAVTELKQTFVAIQPEIIRSVEAMHKLEEKASPSLWQRMTAAMKDWKSNLAAVFSADAMGELFNSVVTGAMSIKDGLKAVGDKAAGWLGDTMAAGLSAIPIAGPFLSKLGPSLAQGLKSIGGKIAGWLGFGASEAEKQAKEMYDSFTAMGKEAWGKTEAFQRAYNDASVAKWNENTKIVLASFAAQADAAGVSFAEAKAVAMDYINAKKAGDVEAMQSAEEMYRKWAEASGANAEEVNGHLAAMEAAHQAAMDKMSDRAVGAFQKAKDAGEEAYQATIEAGMKAEVAAQEAAEKTKDALVKAQEAYEKASIKAAEAAAKAAEKGTDKAIAAAEKAKAAQEDAWWALQNANEDYNDALNAQDEARLENELNLIDNAKEARDDAIAETLQAEKEKFVRLQAFEAALEAVRSGNAAGAVEAARQAAQETATAWDAAMEAVKTAEQATTEALTGGMGQIAGAASGAAGAAASIGSALQSIPPVIETVIAVKHHTTYSASGSSTEVGTGETDTETETIIGETPGGGGPLFNRGSGGIIDFGRGTRATLHGKEAVMTQQQIERLIAAAAAGGGQGGDIVVQVGNREIARYMLSQLRDQAQGRGY